MAMEPSSPKSWPATAARSAAGTKLSMAALIAPDPLVQRQGDQLIGREAEPIERVGGGAGPGGRLAETARQILRRLLDAGHRDARKLARALQRLDRCDRGAERLRQLRLRIDSLQAGADHRHAGRGGGSDGGRHRDRHPAREGGEPRVGRFHLTAETAKAPRPGFAHALEFGAHLPSAHGREADANPFFRHGSDPSVR